jgi:hypothetical protein
MRLMHNGRLALAAAALLVSGGLLMAQEAKPAKPVKDVAGFGSLDTMSVEAAKVKAAEWFKAAGKNDTKAFDAIWATADKTILDKVSDTLTLGDADAAKLLTEARDPKSPAPTDVPDIFSDGKKSLFFRANLALAYTKALSTRRVYEEVLETMSLFKPEQVVDPASFLFHKAVAEHATLKKTEAIKSISRLLEDCNDAPERYKMVAFLMANDIKDWKDEKEKEVMQRLNWVGRMMNNIERRLDLSRGGPTTQDQQKRVLLTLDEIIKELEKQGDCDCNGNCNKPGNGNKPNKNLKASSPQKDSFGGDGAGPGNVEAKKFKETTENWGSMPAKDRAKAALDLAREMPAKHRELIETYLKKLAQNDK